MVMFYFPNDFYIYQNAFVLAPHFSLLYQSLIYINMDSWIFVLYSYSNTIIIYLFIYCSSFSSFSLQVLLQLWILCPFYVFSSSPFLLSSSLLSRPLDVPGSSWIIPVAALESTASLRSLILFIGKSVFINQDLGNSCAYCY